MARTAYNELDYAYAVARISALKKNLINAAGYEKLIGTTSAEDAEKTLANMGRRVSENYEGMLSDELRDLFALIESLGGGRFLMTQRVKYDYHNVKVLIKSELTKISADGILSDLGAIGKAAIKNAVLNRDYRIMPHEMKTAVVQAYEQYARIADVQLTDIIFDKALLGDMQRFAQEQPEQRITDLVKTQIDMHNIKTFVRVRRMGKSHGFIEKVIANGGHIPPGFYTSRISAAAEGEGAMFEGTPYSKGFAPDANLERELDNIFLDKVKKAGAGAFGLAPLAAYFWIKENEIRNIRIILTCKKAGIDPETIRRRLRG